MTKRYLGNIITQNPTAPAGNFEGSAAKGVWSLEEQLAYQKAGLWPVAGNAPVDITDVFSTYLYTGTSSAQTITNGIDLEGEGGLVWLKSRSNTYDNWLYDTVRGNTVRLISNTTAAQGSTGANGITSFNSDGFGLGAPFTEINGSGSTFASWTFRKAPKFFTCLTYTGDSNATQTVNHDLGSVPGMIIIKKTDGTSNWTVYHRSAGSYRLRLNTTEAQDENGFWATSPTDTAFTLSNSDVKSDGATYVAYLFAHNDGDGGFGPDADQDIIKCGSYTGNGVAGHVIDLGFEAQWVMIKKTDGATDWVFYDAMRGMPTEGNGKRLSPNASNAETDASRIGANSNGFALPSVNSQVNQNNANYIYIAIRRGPLAPPTAGTEVFKVNTGTGTIPTYLAGFPVDMSLNKQASAVVDMRSGTRLTGANRLVTNSTAAATSDSAFVYDYSDGWSESYANSTHYSWMWKRAPSFCDVVAYTGTGSARTVSHNLGAAPEMMWIKSRSDNESWAVYHAGITNPEQNYLYLNEGSALNPNANTIKYWNHTNPTDSVFTVGIEDRVNGSAKTYIAYLFASLDGISRCGSYTGNGSSQTIDCGFTSGARFVLIRRTDSSGDWNFYDTERGMVAGNDSRLSLNTTDAEDTSNDRVDSSSSGFAVNYIATGTSDSNISGASYIFYAIA